MWRTSRRGGAHSSHPPHFHPFFTTGSHRLGSILVHLPGVCLRGAPSVGSCSRSPGRRSAQQRPARLPRREYPLIPSTCPNVARLEDRASGQSVAAQTAEPGPFFPSQGQDPSLRPCVGGGSTLENWPTVIRDRSVAGNICARCCMGLPLYVARSCTYRTSCLSLFPRAAPPGRDAPGERGRGGFPHGSSADGGID